MFGEKCFAAGEVHVIPNAIDPGKYAFSIDDRQSVIKELELENKFVVGHVGRFAYQKNHLFLVDIFYEIYKQNSNAVLLLVGAGKLEASIRKKVDKLGLTQHVLFMGIRNDVPKLLQAMDVFIFPSTYEGLGVVLIEAQAAGLKCYASETGIPKEAKITNLLEFISLSSGAQVWAETVLSNKDTSSRRETKDEVIKAGFEINSASKNLLTLYQTLTDA
jgi:glycosyltransferase involved in cell wall biosynthesis